jgi:beta-glucosidase
VIKVGSLVRTVVALVAASLVVGACSSDASPHYLDPNATLAQRVDDLISRMTLDEKFAQMTLVDKNAIDLEDVTTLGIGGILSGGGGSPDVNTAEAWAEMVSGFQDAALESRLGIPLLYGVDAVHGHGNVRGAVIFPHNIGLGAADDPDLMERVAEVTAAEMIATGIYWNYAPAVSVPLDIRWGRTYEGFSEDTDRVTRLATAYLEGLQGGDLSASTTALATPKHFVGDGGTEWGSSTTDGYRIDQGVTLGDEPTLRSIHLPPYEAAIDAGALSIMVSYSSWGGLKMHAHEYLITDVLKGELGFEGFVVSDWGGVTQISDNFYEAVVTSVNAGIDMNMVPTDYAGFISTLAKAVDSGDISIERVDDAVKRILTAKFALGLFERPHGNPDLLERVGSPEHRAVAREAVAASQVLLKNNDGMLPLDPEIPTLYVGGRAADDVGLQSGGWTIAWQGASGAITDGTTILDGIRASVSENTEVVYERSGQFEAGTTEMSCVAVVAEFPYAEGVGDDSEPRLPSSDEALLSRMREQCAQLAVVIMSGRPLIITDLIDSWDALIAAWLPGTEGDGVAEVLFGSRPFSGSLPYTWPRDVEQLPIDPNRPIEDPLFARGFGLSG